MDVHSWRCKVNNDKNYFYFQIMSVITLGAQARIRAQLTSMSSPFDDCEHRQVMFGHGSLSMAESA